MHIERLNKLIEILLKVPNKSFDLTQWTNVKELSQQVDCGTVACAVGWACFDKSFNEEGLNYQEVEQNLFGTQYMTPVFEGSTGWDAVEAFFDISLGASEFLFETHAYENHSWYADRSVQPKDVINRIRLLMQNDSVTELSALMDLSDKLVEDYKLKQTE